MNQFSLYKVVQILLPYVRRTARSIAWLKVFVSYLATLAEEQFRYRAKTLKEARMTPQVCFLEKLLNDRYGVTTIKIVEGYELGPWAYFAGPPVGTDDLFMVEPGNYCYSANVVISVDFVVEVPTALSAECNTIAAYVQKYKLAGKSFIIQLI